MIRLTDNISSTLLNPKFFIKERTVDLVFLRLSLNTTAAHIQVWDMVASWLRR